jgi:DNA-binding transcriptional ArsR family regulator
MPRHGWSLLTNHALALVHVIEQPRSTLREIADAVGVTDRAALSLVRALEEDNILIRRKEGRRNVYTCDIDALMAHRSHGQYSIGQIAAALLAIAGRVPAVQLPAELQIIRGGDAPPAAASASE